MTEAELAGYIATPPLNLAVQCIRPHLYHTTSRQSLSEKEVRYYTRVSLRDATEARARLNTIENRTLIHFNLHEGVTNNVKKENS